MSLKIDLINGAYSQMRISGVTLSPTSEDIATALDRLETLCAELEDRNVCFDYNFEDDPDPNSVHNVQRKYWNALETTLALRLLGDFGKPITPELAASARASMSALVAGTAKPRHVAYPSRQAVGSGNDLRFFRYQRFYNGEDRAPNECETNKMFKDDINDFVAHFDSYLGAGETLSSYTLTADDGLTVLTESLSSPDVNYRIRADGTASGNDVRLKVVIKATTSLGRVKTQIIYFVIVDPDDA